MSNQLGFLTKLRYIFLPVLICIAIALYSSRGSINFGAWGVSIVGLFIFLILWAIHTGVGRKNRLFTRIAYLVELVVLFISSMMMGGDDVTIGYASHNSVTFLGKTYEYEDPAHQRISNLVTLVFGIWSFALAAILLTILISLFLKDANRENH